MLIQKENCCLFILNIQREFIPSLNKGQNLVDSCCWLADLAEEFKIPTVVINHKKLGEPLPSIKKIAKNATEFEVTHFSCVEEAHVNQQLQAINKTQVLLAGAESHISIFQSALTLKDIKIEPFVIIDSIATRNKIDNDTAILRLNHFKIQLVTKEMVFFELLRQSEYPNYIDLSLKFLDNRYIRE